MNDDDRRIVHAEWDDELDAAELAALDTQAAADPALAAYRAEMRALHDDLRALGDETPKVPPLDLGALAETEPPSGVGLPWWMIAAAAAAALIAAGVYYSSRTPAPDAYEEALTAAAPEVAPAFPSNQPARPDAPVEAPQTGPETIAFRMMAPEAKIVAVAGDFNGWKPEALTMTRSSDGIWVAQAALPPGRYAYMYVVDGDWMTPPDAKRTQDDGFGSRNAVIDVL